MVPSCQMSTSTILRPTCGRAVRICPAAAAAVVIDGKVLLIGGYNVTEGHLAAVDEYDPVCDCWIPREPLLTPRSYLAAAVLNGIVYAIGGENSQSPYPGGYLSVVEAYDPALDPTRRKDLFLHGSGATANPLVLFLDTVRPVSTAAKYKDSGGIKFAGGNPWAQLGTWNGGPASSVGTLASPTRLQTWVGLKNSDDQGTRFDVRAEIYRNAAFVAAGETYCIEGVTRNPGLAKEVTISLAPFSPVTFDGVSDGLSLRVLTRIGTYDFGQFCGGHSNAVGPRLYFDASTRLSRFGSGN